MQDLKTKDIMWNDVRHILFWHAKEKKKWKYEYGKLSFNFQFI